MGRRSREDSVVPTSLTAIAATGLWLLGVVAGQTAAPAAAQDRSGGDRALVDEGRSLFNQHCSHCHAPNAVNPDPRTDLRRLRLRYGDTMTEAFYTAVTEGRPTKGMPPWKASLGEETIRKILAFLRSVQKDP